MTATVRREGRGAPVLALHSSGLSGLQWRHLVRRLRDRATVYTPDLLGYGGAPWPADRPFVMDDDLAPLETLLADLGAAPLVGHSYGGTLAMHLALRHGERVPRLVVWEPVCLGVLYTTGDPEGLADLERHDVEGGFFHPARRGTEAWLRDFVTYWSGPGSWEALPSVVRERFGRARYKLFDEVHVQAIDRTPPSTWAEVRCPTLILRGEHTTAAERRVCDLLAEALPAARLEVVPGAGHMGPVTHAEPVSERIAAWLKAGS